MFVPVIQKVFVNPIIVSFLVRNVFDGDVIKAVNGSPGKRKEKQRVAGQGELGVAVQACFFEYGRQLELFSGERVVSGSSRR